MNNYSARLGCASLLDLYVREWNRYSCAVRAINGVCRYLNKCLRSNYETAQYPSGTSAPGLHFQPVTIQIGSSRTEKLELRIISVEDVAISVWKNLILRYFREREENVLVKNFLSALRDPSANQSDLKLFIDSFRWCEDLNLIAMIEADTREYYLNISSRFIASNSTSAYVLFATGELMKETERAKYLWESDASAIEIISRTCELELIEKHKDKLQEEFERMLQSERINDLNILFKLLGKNEGTTAALQQCLKQLIIKDFEKSYSATSQSCLEIVTLVIQTYQKYVKFIEAAFDNEQIMQDTLMESMSVIMNQKIKKSWLLFSTFIDDKLRKQGIVDESSYEIMKLFAGLTDKFDDFVMEYMEKMAKRIIFHAIDLASEEKLLSILRSIEKFTAEQNCHLNRMLQDFKEKPDSSVLVLTSHSWPSSCNHMTVDRNVIPESLSSLMEAFEDEYREIHCGRRLQWCPQLMTVELANGTVMTLLQYQILSSLPVSANPQELAAVLGRQVNEVSISLKVLLEAGVIGLDSSKGTFEFLALPSNLNLVPLNDGASEEMENIPSDLNPISSGVDESLQIRQSFIIQSLLTVILKRQRQASPAELRKLLLSAAGGVKHGHAFVPQMEEIDLAINGLVDKGYLEFNEKEHLYIYIP